MTYLHPLLDEPYLAKTYGIFVYQEDIMSAAIVRFPHERRNRTMRKYPA